MAEDGVDLRFEERAAHASASDVKHELEQGIMNAIDLQAPSEYRKWLVAYVRFLVSHIARNGSAAHQEETKLRKICTNLLKATEPDMLDEHPVTFLKHHILPEIMKVRDLQHLTEEIFDWINHM